MRKKTILGWHLTDGDTLSNGDGRKIVVGDTLSVDGEIRPGYRGLHLSPTILDALLHRPGDTTHLWRMRGSGTVLPHGDPVDTYVCSERTALWVIEGEQVDALFRRFARWCAVEVADLWPDGVNGAAVARWLVGGDEGDRPAAVAAASAASAASSGSFGSTSAAYAASAVFAAVDFVSTSASAFASYPAVSAATAAGSAAAASGSASDAASAADAYADAYAVERKRQARTLDRWAMALHRGERLPRRLAWSEIDPKARAALRSALKGKK